MKTLSKATLPCLLWIACCLFTQKTIANISCNFSFTSDTIGCSSIMLCATANEVSSSAIVERIWDLTSTSGTYTQSGNNPSFCYNLTNPGQYCLSLSSKNANGEVCQVQKCPIHIYPQPVFSGNLFLDTIACPSPPTIITIADQSLYGNLSKWNFGDTNDTSYGTNPSHIYTKSGTYFITEIVSNHLVCSDTAVVAIITVLGPRMTVVQTPDAVCACGDTVHFAISAVSAKALTLLYGCNIGFERVDSIAPIGTTSNPTLVNISFPYCITDTCIPQMLLEDSNGCMLFYNLDPIVLTLHANFNNVPTGNSIQFTNWSTGVYQTMLWNFGDSATASSNNPTHIYAQPGTYNVTLTIYDTIGGCSDDFVKTIVIGNPQSISDMDDVYSVRLIPNPFAENAVLKIEGGTVANVEVRIADLFGCLVRVLKTNADGNATIERGNLPSGMYIYELIAKGRQIGKGKMMVK